MQTRVIHLLALCLLAVLPACLDKGADTHDDLALAREYMLNRDFMEAEKSFERYLRSNPNGKYRWEVWNELVDLALNVRYDRNAGIELLRAMQQEYMQHEYDGQSEYRLYRRLIMDRLAHLYEQSRYYDGAVELWGRLAKDAENPAIKRAESLRNLARIYLRRLEFESSKDVLVLCMEMEIPQSSKSDCRYDLADLYMIMDDMDAGIKELRSLLEQEGVDDDKRILSIFMLADALEQQGNRESALGLFESIRFSYPNARVVEARIEYLKNSKKDRENQYK
jgi:tetratricopeptide (TPR) repeat protein